MDSNAKLSLDLLIGLSVFLFTFIYVANFLPGVFADVRYEISLGSQAYRVATLLVEDSGYPSDWENTVDVSNCKSQFRPGLANFELGNGTLHNNLNVSKIKKLVDLSQSSCYKEVREYLGLSVTNQSYHFNLTLSDLNGTVLAAGGMAVPQGGQVIKFERIVYVDNCTAMPCDSIADRCVCKLEVAVWI